MTKNIIIVDKELERIKYIINNIIKTTRSIYITIGKNSFRKSIIHRPPHRLLNYTYYLLN